MGRKKSDNPKTYALWHRLDKETYDRWMDIPAKRRRQLINIAIVKEFQRITDSMPDYFTKINDTGLVVVKIPKEWEEEDTNWI